MKEIAETVKLRRMTTTFGLRLKTLREELGWSQEKLGFELDVTGATVSKWEHDRSEPNMRQLVTLRQIFSSGSTTLDWLIAGDQLPKVSNSGAKLNVDELTLLTSFRQLPPRKQKLLIGLIEE